MTRRLHPGQPRPPVPGARRRARRHRRREPHHHARSVRRRRLLRAVSHRRPRDRRHRPRTSPGRRASRTSRAAKSTCGDRAATTRASTRLNASLAKAGKPPVKVVAADEQLEDEDLLEMVNAGLMPATIVDDYLATFWAQVFDQHHRPRRDLPSTTTAGSPGRVPQGQPAAQGGGRRFARQPRQGDACGQRGPAALSQEHRLREERGVRRRNGASSERSSSCSRSTASSTTSPWLLLAAQGYQESQLDQTTEQRAGAVGVMQIKPADGRRRDRQHRRVETSAENNIHAGVKYLRFIIDQYFKDEPMDGVNKGLFAIASYNAGPARIAQLRAKATRAGLDPNVWFRNVEVVAAARDRARDGAVRRQHLQVLRELQADCWRDGTARRADAGRFEDRPQAPVT